jgi:hypothetical protein
VYVAAASAVVSGSATDTRSPASQVKPGPTTKATYRMLLLRGMAPDEAANLTAYLAGIPVGEAHWTLRQINELLFLRQMQRTGHFGHTDGAAAH